MCCVQSQVDAAGNRVPTSSDFKRVLQHVMEQRISATIKCVDDANISLLVRTLSVLAPRDMTWKSTRSFLLSDQNEVLASGPASPAGLCRVRVSGYIRGAPLNVNSLVHIVGVGTCRIETVDTAVQPYDSSRSSNQKAPRSFAADRSK
jgi:hypothetical protein